MFPCVFWYLTQKIKSASAFSSPSQNNNSSTEHIKSLQINRTVMMKQSSGHVVSVKPLTKFGAFGPASPGVPVHLKSCPEDDVYEQIDGQVDKVVDDYNKDHWDEGGKSDCGYSEGVHDTLMSLGETFYNVLGEPSEDLQQRMKGIGSYFMEMSYAVRDLQRGNWKDDAQLLEAASEEEDEEDE